MKVIAKYTKPGGREGFVGRNVFARYSKLSNKKAQDVLSRVSSYVLHREVKRPKTYNPIILYLPRELLQADLIDLANLHEANEGAKYILIVCDAFTRKCWARSLKNKTAKNVLNAAAWPKLLLLGLLSNSALVRVGSCTESLHLPSALSLARLWHSLARCPGMKQKKQES